MTPQELKTRRLALGLSQEHLARLLDVTTSTVARWEQGKGKIGSPSMLNLALTCLELGKQHPELLNIEKRSSNFPNQIV